MFSISIIIISYNTSLLLRQCLSSVYKVLSSNGISQETEVIVVDNASSDGSCEMVKKEFPQVKLIANEKNLGFAKANNQAIKVAKGEYLLLLNSDTKVKENIFVNLIDVIKRDENIGVVGGRLLNRDGSIQPSVGFIPDLFRVFLWMTFLDDILFFSRLFKSYHVEDKKFYQKPQQADWVSGACILINRQVIGKVGLLDEKIFMYGEEIEFCFRVRKKGYRILYTPKASVSHLKGGSGGGKEAGIVEEYTFLKYFYRKYKPAWQYPILTTLLMFGALLRLMVFGIISRYPERVSLYAKILKLAGR